MQKRIFAKLKHHINNEKQINHYGNSNLFDFLWRLAFYDIKMSKIVEPGKFIVMVGASSDDKDLLKDTFKVK